jgi:DNA-binding NarL/FixJ family response regulator
MSSPPIRVLVVDDQTLVRDGLVTMLKLTPSVEVVGSAADGGEAIRAAQSLHPDIVLMDLRMPRTDGVEATRRIVESLPQTRVIVLTTYADDASVFAALQAGARGYLTKEANLEEISRAIATVANGDALLDPSVQRRLLETVAQGRLPSAQAGKDGYPDGLTQREVDVLRCMAEGLSNQEIADRLHVSEATVKTHINNIFSKAELRDRGQAVAYAFRNGLALP